MGRQNNKNPSQERLSHLLDKQKSQEAAADDFEKEALEGFAMLENQQEALDLKAELDQRMAREVLPDEKRSSMRYWLAAAGFLLVVGLSVYFTWSSGIVKQQENLAMNTPASKPEEKMPPPVVAETPAATVTEKREEAPAKTNPSQPAKPKRETNTMAAEGKMSGGMAQSSSAELSDANLNDDKKERQKIMSNSGADDEITSAPRQAKEEEAAPPSEPATEKSKNSNYSWSSESEVKPVQKDVALKSFSQGSAAAPSNAYSSPPGMKKQIFVLSAPVVYAGGDEALKKDLAKKFSEKTLDVKFEARLFINKKGVVENAELTKPFNLDEAQQKQVIAILKTLNRFKAETTTTNKKLPEYLLAYP